MLCISIYTFYSGKLFGRSITSGIKSDDHPIFYWVALSLWTLLTITILLSHFIGKEKLKRITDYLNNKKL